MTSPSPVVPRVERGQIYQNVYAKRDEERPVVRSAVLERARVSDGALCFDGDAARSRAFADGVFLLEVPRDSDLRAPDLFSQQFHLGRAVEPYGRFRDLTSETFGDPLLGFHQRVNQIEQFLLERRYWAAHYPPEITATGEMFSVLGRAVLRSVLQAVGIPPEDWFRASGGCSEGMGSYHLTFNHYRPHFDSCGLSSHKDDGFVTVLRTTNPGLEANRHGEWESVDADDRAFVVNFGLAMEILTAECRSAVAAIMHRVRRQSTDRSSFGHFTSSNCEPGRDLGIFRFRPGIGLELVCASRELIDNNDHEIYEGTERPSGE